MPIEPNDSNGRKLLKKILQNKKSKVEWIDKYWSQSIPMCNIYVFVLMNLFVLQSIRLKQHYYLSFKILL